MPTAEVKTELRRREALAHPHGACYRECIPAERAARTFGPADPGAIDRFRRITEGCEYLSAHLKDNAHGNGHSRPGPTAPPRADAGMPGEYPEAASRVLTMLEETWQAIRARHPEIPPVVIIIASGTTGRDARWGRFDSQRWTVHTTGTLTKILLIQTTPVTHLRGWYGVRRPRPWRTPQRS